MKIKDEYNSNQPAGFSVFIPWLSLSPYIFVRLWHGNIFKCISSNVAALKEGQLIT